MANAIKDETIEYLGVLSEIEIADGEKEGVKQYVEQTLGFVERLRGLDTEGAEPMTHVFPNNNVFRDDVVTSGDVRDEMLSNAPAKKDGMYKVPRLVES